MNLSSLEPPYFFLFTGSDEEFGQCVFRLNYEHGRQFAVRLVRGEKMQTMEELFDEFAAAFQFPTYFGENWAALDECLSDLDWLPAEGYVTAVSNTALVLGKEDTEDQAVFFRLLSRICSYWAQHHKDARTRAIKRAPFHVLFHAGEPDTELVETLLISAGSGIKKFDSRSCR